MGRDGQHTEKVGPQFCWTETHHCFLRWLPLQSEATGQLCPTFLSTLPPAPPHLLPQMALPLHRDSRGLSQTSLRLYPVFARAAPSSHLPSILFCIVTFLWLGERSVTNPPSFPIFSGLGIPRRWDLLCQPGKNWANWDTRLPMSLPWLLPLSIYMGLCLPGYRPQSPTSSSSPSLSRACRPHSV